MADENFKNIADNHLGAYKKEAKNEGLDPEKSVLGMLLAITVQLEHKHGKQAAYKILSGFSETLRPVGA